MIIIKTIWEKLPGKGCYVDRRWAVERIFLALVNFSNGVMFFLRGVAPFTIKTKAIDMILAVKNFLESSVYTIVKGVFDFFEVEYDHLIQKALPLGKLY